MKSAEKGRYFLAIVPLSPLQERMLDIKAYFRDQFNCKAPLRSPAHLTLLMPFTFKETKEAQLVKKLENMVINQSPFDLALNGFGAFAPRTIFIAVEASVQLMSFQKELTQFTKRELGLFNTNYKDQGYQPHITVAFRDLKKALFAEAWDQFRDREFSDTFKVSSFWLLKHDGKEWHLHAEFPFGSPS